MWDGSPLRILWTPGRTETWSPRKSFLLSNIRVTLYYKCTDFKICGGAAGKL